MNDRFSLSLSGYAVSARDSTRISDLASMGKTLELFKLQEGFFPNPTDFNTISYSGSLAWRQGTFGEDVRQATKRINTIPVDPLTGNQYAYSVTNTRQEYELGSITENPISHNNVIIPLVPSNTANADNSFFSYIKGNYNKQIVTVEDPNEITLYVLGVPTIITTEITDVTVQEILANQSFAIKGKKNLPSSYATNLPVGQTHTGSASFTPGTVTLTAPLIYQGTISDLSNSSERQQFGEDLKSYFANSNISGQSPYSIIADLQIGGEIAYVDTLIQTDTGGLPGKSITNTVTIINPPIVFTTNPKADPNCYGAIVGTIGAWTGCNGELIVDNTIIAAAGSVSGSGDETFSITGPDTNEYTFEDSAFNVFTGNVTDMSNLFRNTSFNGDIGYWDVSNVTSVSMLFRGTSFNRDISSWDTSSIELFTGLFFDNSIFNQDISLWDTGSAIRMNSMFTNATSFNQDISLWNTIDVTRMENMFNGAAAFDQNIGGWNIAKVTLMQYMFQGATAFNQDLNLWDTGLVTQMRNTFSGATSFNGNISGWNTVRNGNMADMFNGATLFNQDISLWDIREVTNSANFDTDTIGSWIAGEKPCFWVTADLNLDGKINCGDSTA